MHYKTMFFILIKFIISLNSLFSDKHVEKYWSSHWRKYWEKSVYWYELNMVKQSDEYSLKFWVNQ